MAEALVAPMAPDMDLPDGYVVQWSAIDANGNDVSGVVVTNVSLFGTDLDTGTGGGGEDLGQFYLVPGPGS